MKKNLTVFLSLVFCLLAFVSCDENDNTYNEYNNWKERNSVFFAQTMAVAKDTIAKSKEQYGSDWENHCNWRTFKTTSLIDSIKGKQTDSICVEIIEKGTGSGSPLYTDSVRVNYRGYLMETITEEGQRVNHVFDHTGRYESFEAVFNPLSSLPTTQCVSSLIRGYATALQYMHIGDLWRIYIPADLAYGGNNNSVIPAHSTLIFEVQLKSYYRSGVIPPVYQ